MLNNNVVNNDVQSDKSSHVELTSTLTKYYQQIGSRTTLRNDVYKYDDMLDGTIARLINLIVADPLAPERQAKKPGSAAVSHYLVLPSSAAYVRIICTTIAMLLLLHRHHF